METIDIIYEITLTHKQTIEAVCHDIALEQTVELPDKLVNDEHIQKHIVGNIKTINPIHSNLYRAVISYNPEITAYNAPQLLNILFGNISLKNNIKIVDVNFPESFLEHFKGPRFGISGIRELLGIFGRPMFSTALKPLGLSPEKFAIMTGEFALGGGDIIKDDHGLTDQSFCNFYERTARCQEAVSEVYEKTGHKCLYFPNICSSRDEMDKQLCYAQKLSVEGILISPFLLGPDILCHIRNNFNFIIMAHPSLTGTHFSSPIHGISPEFLLGTLFRLFGADISIYPNTAGRFGFTLAQCKRINENLSIKPLGNLKPSFGAPAGGMSMDNINHMALHYGHDVVYLIGGALQGYGTNLEKSTRAFLDRIRSLFNEKKMKPKPIKCEVQSSCEIGKTSKKDVIQKIMKFTPDTFTWKGRTPLVYKSTKELDFSAVVRHELTGTHGEHTSFDLRYFQIEKGGYSSLEKHEHEHVVICLTGRGVLKCGGDVYELAPFDIAYVPPFFAHQLINKGDKPFGFFCIVDHERDSPFKP